MHQLGGRTALVSGASRGLGRLIALALADRQVDLVLAARGEHELEETAAAARSRGVQAVAVAADLADPGAPARLVQRSLTEFGTIDVLVNNAGVQCLGSFEDADPDALLAAVQVNLNSAMLLTRLLLPGMLVSGGGHVVNIASLLGKVGAAYNVVYSASKFGLVGMTQALRSEYHGSGIGFSAVLPGIVRDEGMAVSLGNIPHLRARTLVGTTTAIRVARATVRAIERDLPEVVVNPTPVRPLIGVGVLAPRAVEPITRALGVPQMYRKALAVREGD